MKPQPPRAHAVGVWTVEVELQQLTRGFEWGAVQGWDPGDGLHTPLRAHRTRSSKVGMCGSCWQL